MWSKAQSSAVCLSSGSITKLFKKAARKCGMKSPEKFGGQALRRYLRTLLDRAEGISEEAKLSRMRHNSVSASRNYMHLDHIAEANAYRAFGLFPPVKAPLKAVPLLPPLPESLNSFASSVFLEKKESSMTDSKPPAKRLCIKKVDHSTKQDAIAPKEAKLGEKGRNRSETFDVLEVLEEDNNQSDNEDDQERVYLSQKHTLVSHEEDSTR